LPNIISKVDFKEGKKTDTSNLIKFIYVGGINKQKNVFYTLKVFSELSKIVSKKLHLTMIGDGPELYNLRKKYCLETNHTKNIEFTGPLSNSSVLKMINQSNIMIHLSTFEGFGMVVKEAHMCGVPVIALENSGGAAELIEKKYGIVISGNNYKEDSNFIKHKLNFLLNIDTNLLKKSCQDFSEHKFLERYKSILKC
jgi:glycosyltransferase involved in cell wall biosynthesis